MSTGLLVPLDAEGIREAAARLCADVCAVLEIARCSVFLREPGGERFVGIAAHPSGQHEQDVRGFRIGGESDALTSAVVESADPVFVRDTATDPRAAQSAVRRWKVRTLLGLPLTHRGEVIGVAWVDNADRVYPYRPQHIAAAAALTNAAGDAIGRAREAHELRGRLHTVARQAQLLRNASSADHRLAQIVVSGAGLAGIVEAVAELTSKPVTVYDARGSVVAEASAPGDPQLVRVGLLDPGPARALATEAIAAVEPGACRPVGPLLAAGMRHRHLVAPVTLGERRWGHIVVMEHRSRLTSFDEYATRRAAAHVALELTAQERAVVGAREAQQSLARHLLDGVSDKRPVRRAADYLGIAIDGPWVVVHVSTASGHDEPAISGEALATALADALGSAVLDTPVAGGLAVLIEVTDTEAAKRAVARVKAAVANACAQISDERLIAGLSTITRAADGVPRAAREAREVARCAGNFAQTGAHDVLAADDLGPGRLLLLGADPIAVDRYVTDVLGPLLHSDDSLATLLDTLRVFFDAGASVRRCAHVLHVHENTVRQRLDRVKALIGLDVAANRDDQLTVQIGLLVLRLRGTTALPALGE